jgi:hypothetical protein
MQPSRYTKASISDNNPPTNSTPSVCGDWVNPFDFADAVEFFAQSTTSNRNASLARYNYGGVRISHFLPAHMVVGRVTDCEQR